MQKISFKELTLSKEMHKAIDDLGFEEATPIQSEAIPVILEGKDVIGQAQTGTGKTAAFAVPAIEKIDAHDTNVQVLILCPTRELALQVAEETKKLTKYKKGVSLIPLYGGQSYDRQFQALRKGVQIVIGTPGRIMDHIQRGTLSLENVKITVLDEADVMLDMGFRDDIEQILQSTPATRQTLLFSATMPKAILDLTKRYQKSPIHIKITHESITVPQTEQFYFEVKPREKFEALANVVDLHNLKLSLIFANTKRQVDELVENLQARGYLADGLHGDMKQNVREKVLAKFKKGRIELLVATDVAARGLDVENVDAVFNFDMPQDEESYVHRIGRTGRAGASGKAFSFVTGKDMLRLKDIERFIKMRIKRERLPSFEDIDAIRINNFVDEVRKVIEKGNLEEYFVMVEKLTGEDFTTLDVAAALLKMKSESEKKKPVQDFFSDRADFRQSDSDDGKKRKDRRQEKGKKQDFRGIDPEDSARLFLNIGKKDKMRPGDILGAITGETGVSGRLIGNIDMYDAYSYVDVPADIAEVIIDALDGITMRKKKIHAELARPKA